MATNFVFFLGGRDLEMREISDLLTLNGQVVRDAGLGWGAKASAYALEISEAANAGRTPVLIELEVDVVLPDGAVVVDHHNARSGESASILQVLALLGREPTRHDLLIAANDSGYIPAMLALGASAEEVAEVRLADRSAQGISPEQEAEAERAIAAAEVIGGMKVVRMAHSKCATVTDRLFKPGVAEKLLILSGDGEANFYGDGAVCAALKEKFTGSWAGGSGLGKAGESAYWGGYPAHGELLEFLGA